MGLQNQRKHNSHTRTCGRLPPHLLPARTSCTPLAHSPFEAEEFGHQRGYVCLHGGGEPLHADITCSHTRTQPVTQGTWVSGTRVTPPRYHYTSCGSRHHGGINTTAQSCTTRCHPPVAAFTQRLHLYIALDDGQTMASPQRWCLVCADVTKSLVFPSLHHFLLVPSMLTVHQAARFESTGVCN